MKTDKVINYITNWLKSYAENAKMNGFVVGISGGIDSAVVSTLAAKTGLKTLVIEMPIRQKEDQVSRAKEHMIFLKKNYENVECLRVDLTPTFNTFENSVNPQNNYFQDRDLAFANARSRLRMLTLYYYGQIHRLLVTGTGNKIEDFGVGFFTKYGDGGVDVSPIADLMKSEVYKLAEYLDILPEIRQAAPTDGLFGDNRTDEDQLGASYDELEWAMKFSENKSEEDGLSLREKQVLSIFRRLNRINQHKMNPIPICKIPKEYINN